MGAEKSKWHSPIRIHATEALRGLGFPMQDVNGRRQFGNVLKREIFYIYSTFKI